MSAHRWLLSLLLAWHVVAIAIAAMPPPDRLNAIGPARQGDGNPLQRSMTPLLDRAALSYWHAHATMWGSVASLRPVATRYARALGLRHDWNMFANPGRHDQYVRIRYFVESSSDSLTQTSQVTDELIFPAHPEYESRVLKSYGVKHRDKAIDTAMENFHERNDRSSRRRGASAFEPPDDLAPVLRYFVREFEREHLRDGQRVTRGEMWFGLAPASPPSSKRLEILRTYDSTADRGRPGPSPMLFSRAYETEGDIEWRLEYSEEP